ncbi:sensor histidine kinase [Kibdelosporangium philippinense]|uniref:sensor histidine kinase n=1 Tax=Kibdelosporangium philippinense TaxID=211113 RepID=UPI00360D3B61
MMGSDSVGDTDGLVELISAARENILVAYREALTTLESHIVDDTAWLEQAIRQAGAILDEIKCVDLSVETTPSVSDFLPDQLSSEIGETRASHGVHPAESLRAATILFDIVLRELHLSDHADVELTVALSRALHRAIMRRIGVASVSYASLLLEKVHSSHLAERHRMARELHDRAAHAIGVGLQNLQLHDIYVGGQPELSARKLETARVALGEALHTVRALSAELGSALGADRLEVALRKYLAISVSPAIKVKFTVAGDDGVVPAPFAEELYLVLREAVRNSLLHGDPGQIEIAVDIVDGHFNGVVRDDGTGFDVTRVLREGSGVGLTSMRERVELLGGSLKVVSGNTGTVVSVWVHLPGGPS